ncbi:hypothetical protein E4U43_007095 [Claviceps pusilla]|uniref:FAD-binding PCMH-type domain-containing protein n=1 Tax=Claviceps pusilla TaxID=123648 RepID=A0A9P7ND27_9HYPO|nr:hypothetical protein E4U43_007095 [Claviceps pusilla]
MSVSPPAWEGHKSFPDFPPVGFRGRVVRPSDHETYHHVRQIWNARTGSSPALIAQCRHADDVLMAVEYCRDRKEAMAIRGGGHATDGHAMPRNAFVIDMSLMKRIQVDPTTGVTKIEAGVLLGEMDAATQEHGFVVPSGTVSSTGAAGLTLGGGLGFLTRRFGMTVDHLLSVDVVTVDGRRLRASESENPDLFWGLCGAGHNLAIATSFTYQARRVGPRVMSGLVIYAVDDAVAVLTQLDQVLAAAPRELTICPVVLPVPALPHLPKEMTGAAILALVVVYTGCLSAYPEAVAGLRSLAPQPLADTVSSSTWLATNSILDVLSLPGRRQQSRGGYLAAITPQVAQSAVALVRAAPAPEDAARPSVAIAFPCLGGAALDVDEDSMAFSREGAHWLWEVVGQWDSQHEDEEYMIWVDDVMKSLNPLSLDNGYVNLSSDGGAPWLRRLYGSREKWERLCALKNQFDPHNRLCYNKNIRRAADRENKL